MGKGNRRENRTRKGGQKSMQAYLQGYTGTLSDEEVEEIFRYAAYGEESATSRWLEDKSSQVLLRLLARVK